jgi:exodeoxyribonuclease V gamma subunit
VDVALADGSRLTGTVGGVRADVLLSITYSRLGPKPRLHAWVQLAALTVAEPGRPWAAMTVGRGGKGKGPTCSQLGPIQALTAATVLDEVVALYRAGLRAPLPLPVKTSAEYALRRFSGNGAFAARKAASDKWVGRNQVPGEQADGEHVLLYGPDAPLSILTEQPVWPGEGGPGWPADEADRFGLLARRLWSRLLEAENTVQP